MKVYNLNDDSKDVLIGTQNIDRVYGGRGGKKVACKIDDEYYFIKMPNNLQTREKRPNENIEISYNNSPISEYIGSHLSSILEVIRNSNSFKNIDIDAETFFWEMFVVDFLIGNIDRNNGNWGIIKDEIRNTKKMAPVYDNGNCLNNLISDGQIRNIITEDKFDIILEKQLSFFVDDKETPINMYSFLKSKKEKKLNDAINNIVPNIDIKKIDEMIDDISNDIISNIRKEYYKTLILKRYKECLLNL